MKTTDTQKTEMCFTLSEVKKILREHALHELQKLGKIKLDPKGLPIRDMTEKTLNVYENININDDIATDGIVYTINIERIK